MITFIGLIVSIALSLVCFISTLNYISSIVIGVISMLYFSIYVNKKMKNKAEKIARFQNCYHFINNFLISLSIKGHISGALASAVETQNEETKNLINSLDSNDPMGKIIYLKNYFKFDSYSLFIDLLILFNEEGGDIIKMSANLLNQIRESEEFIVNVERMNKTTLIEFSILWSFSLAILAILKFALDDFFHYILNVPFYQIGVVCILLFALISTHVAVKKATNVNIKGWH